ncbi:MAG: SRPBCC family protein [Candidatus Limnocylindrales bacterium]|nr:SRPBCC family protein [Candidatus Limnocylindrales bacterium]
MTIAVEIETRIGRPPAHVFAELAAVERFPEWLIASGIVRVERLDGGPLAVGSKMRIAQTVGGRSTVLDGAITDLEPGRAFGLRGRDRDGVTIEIDSTLATEGDLATRLRWTLRIGLPLRFRMFESMVAPQVRRAATLDLEAFKRRLESVAGG